MISKVKHHIDTNGCKTQNAISDHFILCIFTQREIAFYFFTSRYLLCLHFSLPQINHPHPFKFIFFFFLRFRSLPLSSFSVLCLVLAPIFLYLLENGNLQTEHRTLIRATSMPNIAPDTLSCHLSGRQHLMTSQQLNRFQKPTPPLQTPSSNFRQQLNAIIDLFWGKEDMCSEFLEDVARCVSQMGPRESVRYWHWKENQGVGTGVIFHNNRNNSPTIQTSATFGSS